MENTLRKTLIRVDGIELQFLSVTKFHKFGCKALFYRFDTATSYDVTVLSKSLLQINSCSEQALQIIKKYQHTNAKAVCPIFSITEDSEFIYVISEATEFRLSHLIAKREGLSQFEIIFYALDLMQVMNYLKSRDLYYQILDADDIFLTNHMKISLPFSIWISPISSEKPLLLRHEQKKNYMCPDLYKTSVAACFEEVSAWNLGIFIYELAEGKKPLLGKNCEISFSRSYSPEFVSLVKKLLHPTPSQRLKFSLILVEPLFRKYSSLPHILPATIFSCPPSNQYISEYSSNFPHIPLQDNGSCHKVLDVKTVFQLQSKQSKASFHPRVKSFKSFKHIKPSQWSISEVLSYVCEFVDISDSFGVGYQMSFGLVCFLFNDGSEMQLEQGSKSVNYTNSKKQTFELRLGNISEDGQIKKKVHILQAYTKSIKKFKQASTQNIKQVTVSKYAKTSCAAIFLLTNYTIQVVFEDKMTIMLSKKMVYVQCRNSQKFQPYDSIPEVPDHMLRRKYAETIANRLFHWSLESDVSNV